MFRGLYKFDGPIFGWRAHTRGERAHIRDVNWVNWSIFEEWGWGLYTGGGRINEIVRYFVSE